MKRERETEEELRERANRARLQTAALAHAAVFRADAKRVEGRREREAQEDKELAFVLTRSADWQDAELERLGGLS